MSDDHAEGDPGSSADAPDLSPEAPAEPAQPPVTTPPVPSGEPVSLEKASTGEAAAAGTEEPAEPAPPASGRRFWQRRKSKHGFSRKHKHKAPWWELPALVLLAIVIAIVVKTFVVQPFYIPSESMEKTLHGCSGCEGDRILVNKLIYDIRDPHPGDIVVFNAPPGWDELSTKPPSNPIVRTIRGFGQLIGFVPPDGEVLVKRVIAIGGQTVWGDKEGKVHVRTKNGTDHILNEPFVFNDGIDSRRTFGPVTVPKGRLWVMGDHRNDSQDSRYHCGADGADGDYDSNCDAKASTVPVSDVIGKAFVIAWPPSRWRTLGTPTTFDHLSMALDQSMPSAAGVLGVVPLYVWRRRRRRRPRRTRPASA